MSDSLETKVALLEAEQGHMKESLKELKDQGEETYEIVYGLKERMDKQNGIIPSMSKSLDKIIDRQEQMFETMHGQTVKNVSNGWKIKVLWGIFGVVGTAIAGGLIKFFLF